MASTGVKEMTLLDATRQAEPSALAPRQPDAFTEMIERIAANPDVPVDKMERLLAMQERILDRNAKSAFDGAFARMQSELPEVSEKGQILVKGQLRSTYAKLEDIHEAIKPVLKVHGFAVRHRTEWPQDRPGIIRIIGILSHEQGHSEESVFEAPMDRSDFRTDIQSMGSTVSYGRRYTTLDLLNIATRGQDDDGKKAGAPQAPEGYDDWMVKLSTAANGGLQALEKEFQSGDKKLREYLTQHDALNLAKMRTRARTGKAATA